MLGPLLRCWHYRWGLLRAVRGALGLLELLIAVQEALELLGLLMAVQGALAARVGGDAELDCAAIGFTVDTAAASPSVPRVS